MITGSVQISKGYYYLVFNMYDEYGKRVYFADEYKPQKFYEYIEESNNYEICIDAVCDLDKIYYMDILGEEPVSFLDEEDKEFFNLKYVDGFYYPDMYNETTNIFDIFILSDYISFNSIINCY